MQKKYFGKSALSPIGQKNITDVKTTDRPMFAQGATERQTDDSATDKQWMDNWTLLQLTNQ